jgi:hypothetical protein
VLKYRLMSVSGKSYSSSFLDYHHLHHPFL